MKIRKTQLVSALAAVGLLAGSAAMATATGITTTLTVSGASAIQKTLPASLNFSSTGITLDGDQKTLTSDPIDFGINDARGNGHGWVLQLEASPFSCANSTSNPNCPTAGDSLSGSVLATAPTVACAAAQSTSCANRADVTTVSKVSGDTVITGAGGANVAWAGANAGMGKFNLTDSLKVVLPAYAYAAQYTSQLTITVSDTAPPVGG
jgi:hypothetical protein